MGRGGQVRRDRGSRGDDRGAAAVEFALVALPLFLILFGIIQYGFLFYQIQGASAASKDVAGWAAEGFTDCDAFSKGAYAHAAGYGVGQNLKPSIVTEFDTSGTGRPTVTVTVTVTFTPVALAPIVPVPASVVRSTTTDVESFPQDGVSTTCGP